MASLSIELNDALARRRSLELPGAITPRLLATGPGWSVSDVLCTSGPNDHSFEEQHTGVSIAVVAAGTFQYRCESGRQLMTPGSLLLGNAGEYFECGHEHATGDRCIAFHYTRDYLESLGMPWREFKTPRIPAHQCVADLVAKACGALQKTSHAFLEELALLLAVRVASVTHEHSNDRNGLPAGATARVTRVVRMIDDRPDAELDLAELAAEARLSPYHFLRTFQELTGVTPHQYVLRTRLRKAAVQLCTETRKPQPKILDLSLDCGFRDVSNFNRCFRAEFGVNPRAYRRARF